MTRDRRVTLLALVVMAAAILAARAHTFSEPFDRDIATAILLGRELAAGARMYVDVVEFKPPGAFVLWEVVHLTVGTTVTAVGLTNVLFSVLTLLGIFWGGRGPRTHRTGGVWAAMFWTLIGGELYLQANHPNIEVFMNSGIAWGVSLLLTADVRRATWRRYVLGGLFLTFATLQKHHVLLLCACLGAAWLIGGWYVFRDRDVRRRLLAGFALVAGTIAAAWGLVFGYFAAMGRLGPLLDGLIRYATFYSGSRGGVSAKLPEHANLFGNLRTGLEPSHLCPAFMVFTLPLLLLAAIGITRTLRTPAMRHAGLLILAWFAGTFLVVSLPGTFYPHYYQLWLPVLAVAGGWGMAALYETVRVPGRRVAAGVVVLAPLALWVVPQYFSPPDTWSVKKAGHLYIAARDLGHELGNVLRPDETFYLWGIDPGVYYYAERRPPSGILWVHQLVYGPLHERWSRHVLSDLERHRPALFIVQLPMEGQADHPILRWVAANYRPAPKFECGATFLCYVRKGSRLEGASS